MLLIARKWRSRKTMLYLFAAEFPFTVAALALFAIAQPNTYRTRLWTDGYNNGFNSSPTEILYSYANHRPISPPIIWSQFITDYNVVISVLSMFLMLVKPVLFFMRALIPILSAVVHILLVVLYAYSAYGQSASDMTDKHHPQKGAPWYITKSCDVASDKKNIGYCKQAKASFAVTLCLLILFAITLAVSLYSCVPTKAEKLARAADVEETEIPEYSPETARLDEQEWEKIRSQAEWQYSLPATSNMNPMTPRTVAFQTLEGSSPSTLPNTLPFRERYGGPDGR
ncbi:hypothetical protein E4T48_07356 [Aureobasidium sp. EXF-10727]|nr:hypothetical protein E4T48_07356 [Aureobasidium sp. EXF-10727]